MPVFPLREDRLASTLFEKKLNSGGGIVRRNGKIGVSSADNAIDRRQFCIASLAQNANDTFLAVHDAVDFFGVTPQLCEASFLLSVYNLTGELVLHKGIQAYIRYFGDTSRWG